MARGLFPAIASAVLIALSSPVAAAAQSADAGIAYAEDDDAEVNAAMKAAMASLPAFWARYEAQVPGEGPFLLKVALPTRDKSLEHIWMLVTARTPKITGTLANTPINIDGVRQGSTVTVTEQQVSDWTYVRGGVTYGQFTTRVFAKRMTPAQRVAVMADLSPTPIEGKTP